MQQEFKGSANVRHVMTTPEAADYLRLSCKTLETWRSRGGGPAFVKQGRSVRYPVSYLDDYLQQQTRRSTSDGAAS